MMKITKIGVTFVENSPTDLELRNNLFTETRYVWTIG